MAVFLKVEKQERTAIVTIDHPPLNVMNNQVIQDLKEVFTELEHDDSVTSIILTGAGDRAFMAGADIKEFPQLMGKDELKSEFMKNHDTFHLIESSSKPTIAVLNGLTFGGGCELSLLCDMRIAEEHVQIGLPEIKLGLFPGGGGTQRLPRLIGNAKAKELMFTGDPIQAEAALEAGLVNHIVPKGVGLQKALEIAGKINRYSLPALSRIKKAVNEGVNKTLADGVELEAELFEEVFKTEDIQEGVQAFIEKRKPSFVNK